MTERLLQFIWQFQHFHKGNLTTTAGEPVQILFQGQFNSNQGPDFTDARIRVGDAVWAGTVELHLRTSDWNRHRHQNDTHYNNVALHVVWQHDSDAGKAPVLELQNRVAHILLQYYEELMNATDFIACGSNVRNLRDLAWKSWKERLLAERLLRKAKTVQDYLCQSNGNWEETFWWMLARSFGMKVNADAFESIARSLPLRILARHKSRPDQLEALLLGQAGLLNGDFREEYPDRLKKEYEFQQDKYGLRPVHTPVLFLRMRPVNFPPVRLAQLAMLIHHSVHLFSKIKEAVAVKEVKSWLDITAGSYWDDHYRPDEIGVTQKKRLGAAMADHIIINTVAPVLFAYGHYHHDPASKNKALRWLEETAAETNAITKGFAGLGIEIASAFDSQALIELKNEYCSAKRCLDCTVGNSLLKARNFPSTDPPAEA